jgi:hypothetical protein
MPAKRDTGGHILTEWPFCYVKSAIEHKRRYAQRFWGAPVLFLRSPRHPLGSPAVAYETR